MVLLCIGCTQTSQNEVTNSESDEETTLKNENIPDNSTEENANEESIIPVPSSAEYLLENSDTEVVSSLYLSEMTVYDLQIARNEIYARHGLIFKSANLIEYFESKDWYTPTVSDVADIPLNYTEQVNIQLIQEQEKIKNEGGSLYTSVWSMENIEIQDSYLIIEVEPDGFTSYVSFTGSWDYLITRAIKYEISDECQWYSCSPIAFHENYEDAIASSESVILNILSEEVQAIKDAEATGAPYDTSIGVIVKIENEKIVCVYHVAS